MTPLAGVRIAWQSWLDALSAAVQVHAVDSSSAALAWAQLNVDRLDLASTVLVSKMSSSCIF